MSDTAQAWVWQHSRTRGTARLVLLALAREADDDGTARMGTADLMRLTNATKGATLDGIARAVALGELEIRQPGAGKRAALYALPHAASYQPVSGREFRPLDTPSGRETGPLEPVAVGNSDRKPVAVGNPDRYAAPSGRESGPLQLDLTGALTHATRAQDTRAQASSKAVKSMYEGGKEGPPARVPTIPDFARPLVDTLTASDIAPRWDLTPREWLTLHAMIKNSGVGILAAAAARAAQRTDIGHARYLLRVWRGLPPAPADNTPPVQPTGPGAAVIPLASQRIGRADQAAQWYAQLAQEANAQ